MEVLMKKKLQEAKADIDSGIAKSLSDSHLSFKELSELENLSFIDLITDHGVDSLIAEKVITHTKIERQRHEYQNQYVAREDYERLGSSNRRTYPFRESLKRKIKRIIQENLS